MREGPGDAPLTFIVCRAKHQHFEDATQEAIESFGRLPPNQYATGWVLACIGRAYFEMVDYHQAAQAFQWAKTADPSRLEVTFWILASYLISHPQRQSSCELLRKNVFQWAKTAGYSSL